MCHPARCGQIKPLRSDNVNKGNKMRQSTDCTWCKMVISSHGESLQTSDIMHTLSATLSNECTVGMDYTEIQR